VAAHPPGFRAGADATPVHSYGLGEAMSNPRVWLLTLVYFGQNVSNYGLLIFLPQIVKAFGVSTQMTGWISALPFRVRGIRDDLLGVSAPTAAETARCMWPPPVHCVPPAWRPALSLGTGHPVWMMVAAHPGHHGPAVDRADVLAVADGDAVRVSRRRAGSRLINSVGNLGGFLGPVYVRTDQGSYRQRPDRAVGAVRCAGAVHGDAFWLALGHDKRLERAPVGAE